MWVGFYLVNGCVTTLRLFFPSKTIQAVTPFSQTWFLHVTFMECGWDSNYFFLTEVALIGHLSVKAVTGKDSCPGRSWWALTPGAPLASLYLIESGYGWAGALGSIQKLITPLGFYCCLLCSSGEAVKFSAVSWCSEPWGAGVSKHPASERCFTPPNPSFLGFVLVNSPLPLPVLNVGAAVWGCVVMVQFFSERNSLFIARDVAEGCPEHKVKISASSPVGFVTIFF